MNKNILFVLTITVPLLSTISSSAQEIKWNNAPQKGFVYEISNKEAQKLLTKSTPDTIFIGLLHTQVDTFDVRKGWTNRPIKGHFILAKIIDNKLHCEYTSVFPYQVFLLKEYDALAIQVLDLNGNVRKDAKVKLGYKRLRIDAESQTYRIENSWFNDDNQTATVELDGFRSIFNIQKHDVPLWYNDYDDDEGPVFYSYMITDKNRYKANEKVRFKSYALSHLKTPLRKVLEVWLTNYQKSIKVGQVAAHRLGSFTGEFQLHDSLKLVLDKDYNLQLREKNGRIVANCRFTYEDYELFGNKLEVKLSKSKQFYPENNELTTTATDANGLLLKDAKASILVKTLSIQETFQPLVILPDTLLFTQIDIDPNNPTRVNIPSKLFQKTNTVYQVLVTVLNSQNQRMERAEVATYYYSQYEIVTHFSNDSICFDMLNNSVPMMNVPMKIKHNSELEEKEVRLPYKEKLNPATTIVLLENELASRQISMSQLNPRLELIGGIQKDSFNIQLVNPQKLEISWYVYQGSKLLMKGFGKELDFKSLIEDRTQTYYVELLYSFGGEEHLKRSQYEFKEEFLDVSLDIPERVYPGQQVEATILVKNQLGEPVHDVDLTALSVTSKLNYYLPDLPYYGTSSVPRPQSAHYSKSDVNKRSAVLKLNYLKWKKPVGLDTMKYYQFTYPYSKPFIHTDDIVDSTQFAPYVMQNGSAKQVCVIEVNHSPVYFSWVDQPKEYSFYVSPVGKKEISLRLYDRVLVLDSISFEKGKKTILSIDLDHLPKGTKVFKIGKELTGTERGRYINYISSFKSTYQNCYLESINGFTPLNAEQKYGKGFIVSGPITPGKKTFIIKDGLKTTYQHTGGYNYAFEDNIVYKLNASNLLPNYLSDNIYNPMFNVNDRVMTKKHFLESKENPKPLWHLRTIDIINSEVHIKVLLPYELEASGIAALLFEDTKTKNTIAPCYNSNNDSQPYFYRVPNGLNNAIVLYNNGTYLRMDSINIKKNNSIVVDLNHSMLNPVDSLSRVLLTRYYWLPNNCYTSNVKAYHPNSYYFLPQGQNGNVKGTIYSSEDNLPIPGVSIAVKGTTNGVATNIDGQFSLSIDQSRATLVISFVGFKTQEIEVTIGSHVSVTLKPEMLQLEEVVVTAMGIKHVSYLSGSVSSVSSSDVMREPKDEEEMNESKQDDKEIHEAEQRLYQELLSLNSIRSNFTDVGFWEPRLYTDKKGESKFKVTFPDDITQWDALVYAMNKYAETGTVRKRIRSYKPIMAELNVPQFLTRGDSAQLLGKVLNYTSDSSIVGKVKWSGAQTDFEKDIKFANFHTDKLPVNVINTDSIKTRYIFTRNDGYLDGEERTVPVVEQGIIRADGTLSILNNGEDKHIKALEGETVSVEILDNQIEIYEQEVGYLLQYKYACNEQLASKLIGLVNHKQLMKYVGKPFKYDRDIKRIIERLLKNQNKEFLWSWWDVSPITSYWMSAHILRALKCAKDAGYNVELDIENIARKAEYKFKNLKNFSLYDLDLLHSLAVWGVKLDYSNCIHKIDSIVRLQDNVRYCYRYSFLKEKLLLQEIRQMVGLQYQRDTLLKYKKEGIMGEVYFSDNKPANYWYNDDMSANVIAYRLVKNDSTLKNLRVPMQMYFLSLRKNGEWNTYQSSNVLMSVLPDLLKEGYSKGHAANVTISGKEQGTITKFPYRIELKPKEELSIHKESGLPLYFMQYKKERVSEAKTGVAGFGIHTHFSGDSILLEAGKPVALNVEIDVKKDASFEHVMIEVPIPGACSYADKRQLYNGVETHREYFKERTVIFCENLKAGKYNFIIHLLPRFTGKYLMNPAQVSLMYVPVVNANTKMKHVVVNE